MECKKNTNLSEQITDLMHPMGVQGSEQGLGEQKDETTALADRLRQGDRMAAEELVDRYYQQFFLYMRELGHARDVSEDLTQEVFMRAWSRIAQLRDGKALKSWLYRIASNISSEHWRKRARRQKVDQDQLLGRWVPDMEPLALSDCAGQAEEFRLLLQAVDRLSWKLRQTIVLHYLQGLSIVEAAEAANVKKGTFKSRLNRALATLRETKINDK